MKIGFRTLKTAVGTAVAVFLAQALDLQFVVSAGMMTILCIQPTRKKSLEAAFTRFVSCVIGVTVAILFFHLFGQEPYVVALILLVVIPLTVRLGVSAGVGTSCTVLLQIYNAEVIDFALFLQLILLVIVGVGVAFIVNFYMPKADKELEGHKQMIEEQFCRLFHRMAQEIRGEETYGLDKEIKKTERVVKQGKDLSMRELSNDIIYNDDTFFLYFSTKEKQMDVLKRLFPILNNISSIHEHNYIIADFLDEVSESILNEVSESITLVQLHDMKQQIRSLPLPVTTEEFENRAYLMQFVYEMQQYLLIMRSAKGYQVDDVVL